MKSLVFNGLVMLVAVSLIYLLIRALPDREPRETVSLQLSFEPVTLTPVGGPLRLTGAWELNTNDRRFGGISALAIDNGEFLAVSDRGSVARFSFPTVMPHQVSISDLRDGPGPFGKKWARDAESLARDPQGRGWWIGFEHHHSLWLYDSSFRRSPALVDLNRPDWSDNGGAEGLLVQDGRLVAFGENGRDAIRIEEKGPINLALYANAEVADATRAPDGGGWILLREIGVGGISQSVAPLERTHDGYRVGTAFPVPKEPLDNFEGMTFETRPDGGWRLWLISDNDFRTTARTLLVALDLAASVKHDKSPARGAGLSKKPAVETP